MAKRTHKRTYKMSDKDKEGPPGYVSNRRGSLQDVLKEETISEGVSVSEDGSFVYFLPETSSVVQYRPDDLMEIFSSNFSLREKTFAEIVKKMEKFGIEFSVYGESFTGSSRGPYEHEETFGDTGSSNS